MKEVTPWLWTTEYGWCGPYEFSDRCMFRRMTMVHRGRLEIMVCTVGDMKPDSKKGYEQVAEGVYYHTRAYMVQFGAADTDRELKLNGMTTIGTPNRPCRANLMHDDAVREIKKRIRSNEFRCELPGSAGTDHHLESGSEPSTTSSQK